MEVTKEFATHPVVRIDFPQEDEVIAAPSYTLRFSAAAEVLGVEVSIDEGPWIECRRDAGFFWYDWRGYPPGPHKLLARANLGEGRFQDSGFRRLLVDFGRGKGAA